MRWAQVFYSKKLNSNQTSCFLLGTRLSNSTNAAEPPTAEFEMVNLTIFRTELAVTAFSYMAPTLLTVLAHKHGLMLEKIH